MILWGGLSVGKEVSGVRERLRLGGGSGVAAAHFVKEIHLCFVLNSQDRTPDSTDTDRGS